MKAVIASLALAALVSAQSANITLIPSNISSSCTALLQSLNNDTTLSTCVQPLITATASFNPLSQANISSTDINYSLASMCKANTGCTDPIIRTWLSRFYASCSAELTNPTSYNAQVRELYDILYVVNPLKGAVCSIDSANQQYCVNQVIGVGKNSTGPAGSAATASIASSTGSVAALASSATADATSVSVIASANATASSASASTSASVSASANTTVSNSTASANATATGAPSTAALFTSFAANWSPVQFAADHLYIAYSSASALSKRMIDLIPRQDQPQVQQFATVITPNATTYRSTNLPFLFLQPSFNAQGLCTPCTREIMVAYIKWETAVPYALGLAQSPILGGQMELWNAIEQTCGANFVSAITAQVGQFSGISNSTSAAVGVTGAGLGSAVLGAAVAGSLATI